MFIGWIGGLGYIEGNSNLVDLESTTLIGCCEIWRSGLTLRAAFGPAARWRACHSQFGLAKLLSLRAAFGPAARWRACHSQFGLAKLLSLRAAFGPAARWRACRTAGSVSAGGKTNQKRPAGAGLF
ncbi:MAG: hypothetical protein ACJA1Q_000325 [Pseudohongiellaceae bacterium]|jgi:hypothetical protein